MEANGTTNGNGHALARVESSGSGLAVGVAISSMADVFRLADHLARADGFVPRAYQGRPAAVAAIILTGVELGLGPMTAMREVHLIEGKPTLSATLMLTLARRAGIDTSWVHTDATRAEIEVTIPRKKPQRLAFTLEEAKAAGLLGKDNWKRYPAAMLRARAAAAALRAFCPEVIGGSVYESTSGELTDGVPSAEVIDAQLLEPVKPAASAPRTEQPKHSERDHAPSKLSDCTDADALKAWCAKYGARAVAANKAEPIMHRAEKVGVSPAQARAWLGLEPLPETAPGYDPAAQDAPPPEDELDVD
jgi:hypothetical protein